MIVSLGCLESLVLAKEILGGKVSCEAGFCKKRGPFYGLQQKEKLSVQRYHER